MSLRQRINNYLQVIGVNRKVATDVADKVLFWTEHSGMEWTVKRLKDLKQIRILQLAGIDSPADWVKLDGLGRPAYPFSRLFDLPPATSVRALNIASAILFTQATPSQERKFYESAVDSTPDTYPPVGPVELGESTGVIRLSKPKHWSSYPLTGKRVALSSGKTIPQSHTSKWVIDGSGVLSSMGLRLKQYRQDLISAGLAGTTRESGVYREVSGGRISYLQEPGGKLRVIANPLPVWQVLLGPLKDWAFRELQKFPSDCTFNQEKGPRRVQEVLRSGKTVYAFDLSDATNRFPLSYQIATLAKYLDFSDQTTRNQVDYLVRVSRARWITPSGRIIRFSRGQPLGLGPSFAVFALAHHQVLRDCGATDDDYVLLGDDIAIFDSDVAERYRRWLSDHECKISEQKSIQSHVMSEFAGKIIFPDGYTNNPKWRPITPVNSMSALENFGSRAIALVPSYLRQAAEAYASIPEFFGGLGLNPKGVPYDERVDLAIRLGLLDDSPVLVKQESQVSLLTRVSYEILEQGHRFSSVSVDTAVPTGTRVCSVLPYYRPSHYMGVPTVGYTTDGSVSRPWNSLFHVRKQLGSC